MTLRKAISLILIFSLSSCAHNASVLFMPFDSNDYGIVEPENVKVFNNRLEIGNKYKEVGILKVKGFVDIQTIKERAGFHGANGIVKDGKNYILVKIVYQKKVKDGGSDGISI
jgi:hypothetical protein